MNVTELKQLIKETAAKIKEIKKELRKPHILPTSAQQQSELCKMKLEIRSYYYIYAFLRGKHSNSVESGRKPHFYDIEMIAQYYGKKILPAEALPLFRTWLMLETTTLSK